MGWTHCLLCPWVLVLIIHTLVLPGECNTDYDIMGHHGQGCQPGQFECFSGECLPLIVRCDGATDCADRSDEDSCDYVLCIKPHWFKCENNQCISDSFVCDSDMDCSDLSDEKNCSHNIHLEHLKQCSEHEFRCADNGGCIPSIWACDGHVDCMDGSDEHSGCAREITCSSGEFLCSSGHKHQCIPMHYHCDGEDDCENGVDELDCSKKELSEFEHCTLTNQKFLCKDNRTCIDLSKLCDHTPDCLDKSDEGGNCSDINQCVSMKCPYDCAHTPTGPMCFCPIGSQHVGDECVDIDECLQYGICDQRCNNTKNSFYCSCDPGYKLMNDGRTCKVEDGEGLLLFSTLDEIRGFALKSETYFPVMSHLNKAIGVSYDGHYVYWTEVNEGQESIVRSLKDGSDKMVILNSGLDVPEDLAVDLVTKNIYFTDTELQYIGVCSNDGSACLVLHNQDIDKPRAIALQPNEGLMYWSDWGNRPLIARSGMDGTDVTDFVTTNVHWPICIAIDHGNGRLYWMDAKFLSIESIKLDGTDRRVVSAEVIKRPLSISVFEDSLYWSDFDGNEVQACNKFTGKNIRSVVRETKSKIVGIHIYHDSMNDRINITNPCKDSGCSDMCLLAPSSRQLRYTCACPEDRTLAVNHHSCNRGKNVQLIVAGFGKTLIQLEHKRLGKQTTVTTELAGIEKIGALAYDSLTGHIIISDSGAKKIMSLDLSSGHMTLLVSGDIGKVEGIDVDPLGHNLYWVDSERFTVEVMGIKTSERTTLVRDLGGEMPVDIVLAPHQGYMFVALSGPRGTHIDRFYMNGLGRLLLINEKIVGPSIDMTFDPTLNQLLFADPGSGLIERVDVDGGDRHTFQELYGTPTSVAALQSDIFWASHASSSLEYTNKFQEHPSIKHLPLDITVGWNSMEIIAVTERVAAENHICQRNNGGCSHLCFVTPHSSACGCPNGLSLKSDGLTCEKPIQCLGSQFRCKTGECLPEALHCDHKNDCPLGDDEFDCPTTKQCPRGQYSCHNGEKCLEEHTKCDGHADCFDRSDESNCHVKTCSSDDFQCGSGECLSMVLLCNNVPDCQDSSDEMLCLVKTCLPEKEFRCNSGTCIPSTWECDGFMDCSDGSDEHSKCAWKVLCGSGEFTCNNVRCIEKMLVCDGRDDCGDFSDEASCIATGSPDYDYSIENVKEATHVDNTAPPAVIHKCKIETEFACDSQPGVCLPKAVRCNGTSECLRGEDETNCMDCMNNEFECVTNKICIQREWLCDNVNDCGDNSDEDPMMCKFHNQTSPKKTAFVVQCNTFECKNREQCLPYSKVCDGHPDCNDGSDEGGRCGKSCVNSGCQDICIDTPYGSHCSCLPGYELMGDARTCSDVDECKLGTYCSQYCSNIPGSFVCSCKHSDYMLLQDRMTCKAKGPTMKYIYAFGNQIRFITQTHSQVGVVYNHRGTELRVSGLDVNARKNLVFWTSDLGGSLTKISLDKRSKIEVIKNLVRPTRLSVDWVTGNVYFIENYNQIKVCHFGVQKCALIYATKPDVRIEALVVDPVTRLMFWSETSASHGLLLDLHHPFSAIRRADLQGNSPVTIVDMEVQKISDIAVDSLHGVIYYLDAHHGKIVRSTLNGTNHKIVFLSPDVPVELGLFENNIYWLVKGVNPQRQRELEIYGNVWHCGLHGPTVWKCDVIKIIPKNMLGHPYQFRIMHEALQPEEIDPCKLINCSHMCVLIQSGAACLCENGAHVRPGEKCKVDNTSRAIFATKDVVTTEQKKPFMSWWLLTIILFVFIVLPTIAGVVYFMYHDIMRWCCRDKRKKFIFSSFHFHNNPTYNDNTSHRESVFHHDRLDPGLHQYENPMIGKLNESNVAIVAGNEMNLLSNRKKLEFHLADVPDDESSSVEYSDTLTDSHRLIQ